MNAPDRLARLLDDPCAPVRGWLGRQGHAPFPFQEEVWAAYARGESGLVHAPTGMGKTWAAWLGPLACCTSRPLSRSLPRFSCGLSGRSASPSRP